MTGAVVIGDPGPLREEIGRALARTPGIRLLASLDGRRPVAATLAPLAPAITVLVEPAHSPLPAALIRDARSAVPGGVVIVRASEATPMWVAEALNAGATTVLPATVDAMALGRVVTEIAAETDTADEALRLGWAA
jgi:DNA-binding NarL/FixJ family response regulator